MGVPLVDLNWVDPKVIGISSNYKIEAFVSKFLDKCPILKAGGHSSFFSVLPCSSTKSVCLGRSSTGPPFFYMSLVSLKTYMYLSLSIGSQWVSFERSMWRPPKFTQTHGRPSRPFACCVTSFDFIPLPLPFFLIILFTPPNLCHGTP